MSVVNVTSHNHHQLDSDAHRYHRLLRSVVCDHGGLVIHWPAEKLAGMLDRHETAQRPSTDVADVHWTLPYVSAATTSSTHQSQPVITVSLPVYSNHSHRSLVISSLQASGFLLSDYLTLWFVFVSLQGNGGIKWLVIQEVKVVPFVDLSCCSVTRMQGLAVCVEAL